MPTAVLVSSLVVFLVSENYKANGDTNKADEYLDRALIGAKQQLISQVNSKGQEQITKGKELLAGYKTRADFMNFHWYTADIEALGEAVGCYRPLQDCRS